MATVGYKSCLNLHSCRLRWDMEVEHSTISATSQPHGIAKFPQKEETNQIYTYNIINVLTESGQRLDHGRLVVPDGLDGGEVVVEEVDAVALEEPVGARRLPPRHLQRGVRHAHQPHVARRARGCNAMKRGERGHHLGTRARGHAAVCTRTPLFHVSANVRTSAVSHIQLPESVGAKFAHTRKPIFLRKGGEKGPLLTCARDSS